MRANQLLILFVSAATVILLLVIGVYLLLNNEPVITHDMMGNIITTPSNNGVIGSILISIAAIVLIAVVLYFVFTRKNKTKPAEPEAHDDIYCPRPERSMATKSQEDTKTGNTKPFDVFLCYKKSSGRDFADHLKAGLEELGLHTFEDCKDIPQTVDTQEGWASFRDKALEQSKYFVLVMTPGFALSSEVIKEICMARKQAGKTFVFFRIRSMKRNIVVNLGSEVLDIGKLEQVSFESKEELLRLASNILLSPKTI